MELTASQKRELERQHKNDEAINQLLKQAKGLEQGIERDMKKLASLYGQVHTMSRTESALTHLRRFVADRVDYINFSLQKRLASFPVFAKSDTEGAYRQRFEAMNQREEERRNRVEQKRAPVVIPENQMDDAKSE